MTAETIIALVILLICALPLIIIGIFQMKSKEPVGFWTGVKPPTRERVSDVAAYNKKHGIMWTLYGACIIPAFFLGMIFGEIVAICAMGIEIIGGLVVMIWYHNYLNKKYVAQ